MRFLEGANQLPARLQIYHVCLIYSSKHTELTMRSYQKIVQRCRPQDTLVSPINQKEGLHEPSALVDKFHNVTHQNAGSRKLPPIDLSDKNKKNDEPEAKKETTKDTSTTGTIILKQKKPGINENPKNNFSYDTPQTVSFTNQRGDRSQDVIVEKGWVRLSDYVFFYCDKGDPNFLGNGTFGKVFKGYNQKNKAKERPDAAIKIMDLKKVDLLRCRQQILRQHLVQSDGVVKVYKFKVGSYQGNEYFMAAFEYMDGGELKIPREGFKIKEALQKLIQLLKSYGELYKEGVSHRDLKPSNIMTTKQGKLKITDFGAAMEHSNRKDAANQVTPQYGSPQQCRKKQHTEKCDVYAIGCIFFHLLVGTYPKGAQCTKGFNKMDMKKVKNVLADKNLSPEMYSFLEGCLRQKQFAEIQIDGKKIEDTTKSRLSWEDVFLHPLFQGRLKSIPLSVVGNNILLTLTSLAKSNKDDLQSILNKYQQEQSSLIRKVELIELLRKKNIVIPTEDIDKLHKLLGNQDYFDIKVLLKQIKSLDTNQYSNYDLAKVMEYIKNFQVKSNQPFISPQKWSWIFESWKKQFDQKGHQKRQQIYLKYVSFNAFPILPKYSNLKSIIIKTGEIQALNVRLNAEKLEIFELTQCNIEKIITIRGCPRLIVLKLGYNKIRQIQGIQLLTDLKQLDFQHNRLREIKNISHLKNLEKLNLNFNKISLIQGINDCSSLKLLSLKNNRITDLRPLSYLKIKELTEIKLHNNTIPRTTQNQNALETIEQKFPGLKINLGGYNGKAFDDKGLEYQSIFSGEYKIVPKNNTNKCIHVKQNNSKLIMTLGNMTSESDQAWELKYQEDGQYCIFRKGIPDDAIVSGDKKCSVDVFDEEEDQEKESRYRWIIEKRGKDQRDFFSIKNLSQGARMNYDDEGNIVLPSKNDISYRHAFDYWKQDERDLWYIEPIEN